MQEKAVQYADDSLTTTGFAVIDSTIARRLRPDLWASGFNAASDFSKDPAKLTAIGERRGAAMYECAVEGRAERLLVLAVSMDMLANRIGWITGLRVTAITPYVRQVAGADPARTIDGEEIPAYPCAKRTEMLAKLGMKDTTYDSRTKFPPQRRSL